MGTAYGKPNQPVYEKPCWFVINNQSVGKIRDLEAQFVCSAHIVLTPDVQSRYLELNQDLSRQL